MNFFLFKRFEQKVRDIILSLLRLNSSAGGSQCTMLKKLFHSSCEVKTKVRSSNICYDLAIIIFFVLFSCCIKHMVSRCSSVASNNLLELSKILYFVSLQMAMYVVLERNNVSSEVQKAFKGY